MTGPLTAGVVSLPVDFITQSSAILAMKRVGKSNAAVVIAEEVYRNDLPFVVVDPKGDWYGLRADGEGLKGLDVVIIGGPHGDISVQPTKAAGAAIASFLISERPSAVIDVSDMDSREQAAFLQSFFDVLYRTNTEPLLCILEEADQVVPERSNMLPEQTRLVHSVVKMVKQGGFKGIGTLVITQRAATLNKSVLTQVENLIVLRTASPGDKKVVGEWLDNAVGGKALVADLPSLQQGEAIIVSPFFLPSHGGQPLTRLQFYRRGTFDSGQTPEVGKARAAVRLRDIDLVGLTRSMAEEIEKAKADDPALLRREIKRLETELRGVQENAKETMVTVEVPYIPEEITNLVSDMAMTLPRWGERLAAVHPEPFQAPQPSPTRAKPKAVATHAPTREAVAGTPLKAGARRMVEVLIAMNRHLTKSELSVLSNVSTTGGTWSNYVGAAKAAGFIKQIDNWFSVTEAGRAAFPNVQPLDVAGIEQQWRTKMKAGARRMYEVLKEAWPESVSKPELARLADVATTGGTFSNYVGQITRTGLVERVSDGSLRAADILFE